MAKVTLTFKDTSKGSVTVTTVFSPDLCKGVPMTPAQLFAFEIARGLGGNTAKPAMDAIDQSINGDTDKE
jgi:hypothetical protein